MEVVQWKSQMDSKATGLASTAEGSAARCATAHREQPGLVASSPAGCVCSRCAKPTSSTSKIHRNATRALTDCLGKAWFPRWRFKVIGCSESAVRGLRAHCFNPTSRTCRSQLVLYRQGRFATDLPGGLHSSGERRNLRLD